MATPKAPATGAAWLPLSEAAALAGVSVRAMQKRAASGKIGARKTDTGAAARWEIDGRELPKVGREPDANQDANCEPIGREPGAFLGASKREIGREQDANREPVGRELSPDRETELRSEITFLRGLVESLTQSEAQTKAALREALKAMPKQLTAGALDGAASGNVAGGVAASSGRSTAPDREQFEELDVPTEKQSGAAAVTYDSIADQLERDLRARGL